MNSCSGCLFYSILQNSDTLYGQTTTSTRYGWNFLIPAHFSLLTRGLSQLCFKTSFYPDSNEWWKLVWYWHINESAITWKCSTSVNWFQVSIRVQAERTYVNYITYDTITNRHNCPKHVRQLYLNFSVLTIIYFSCILHIC